MSNLSKQPFRQIFGPLLELLGRDDWRRRPKARRAPRRRVVQPRIYVCSRLADCAREWKSAEQAEDYADSEWAKAVEIKECLEREIRELQHKFKNACDIAEYRLDEASKRRQERLRAEERWAEAKAASLEAKP